MNIDSEQKDNLELFENDEKVRNMENNHKKVMGGINKLSQKICCNNVLTSDGGDSLSVVKNETCLLTCREKEEAKLNDERSRRTGKQDLPVVYFGDSEHTSSIFEKDVSPNKNCNLSENKKKSNKNGK